MEKIGIKASTHILDIGFDCVCALAQASGMGYGKAVVLHRLKRPEEESLGFIHNLSTDDDLAIKIHTAQLTKAWKRAIRVGHHVGSFPTELALAA